MTNTTSSGTYTLNVSPTVTLSTDGSNPTSFFIVVPVGEWEFSAEIFDGASASICSFETSSAKTFTANQILNMSAKEVAAATTGTAKALIGGSYVDVAWVQLWKNGPKFAVKNVGANAYTVSDSAATS